MVDKPFNDFYTIYDDQHNTICTWIIQNIHLILYKIDDHFLRITIFFLPYFHIRLAIGILWQEPVE